ncbi:MAG: radical SAM family heme chaperone HemW, partial [Prolixibacteraceae bacterium]|nr:radical SAM family heme chaperone HemW [Prolixibacteraceae bacterium]
MAGIYIHIPFCRQKCYYCDFYKTIDTQLISQFSGALKKEIILRANYSGEEKIETLYFGGGTPSVLTEKQLTEILQFIFSEFKILDDAEITFEANPDDLSVSYLKSLKQLGINRLSIGIQSFEDEHLKKMNRRHTAVQAIEAVVNAEKTGFNNISVDLIYGLPGQTLSQWKSNLRKVFQLPVQHLSAYHLTYHKGTPFYKWLKKGILKELPESKSIEQFEQLIEMAGKNGFEQYEISNFAKNNQISRHNTSYWMGKKYLGLGPSAHSYNEVSRQWNSADIGSYLKAVEENLPFFEVEVLSENERFNEYILTRIRTRWGVSVREINENFGEEKVRYFLTNIEKQIKLNLVVKQNGIFTLTKEGLFISDEIMTNLMII